MSFLRSFWTVIRTFPRRRLLLMLGWLAAVGLYYAIFKYSIFAADLGRFFGMVIASMILGAWLVIMGRSAREYAEAKHHQDVDLREHIWEISASYLIFVAATAYNTAGLVGEPMQLSSLPTMLLAGPLGLHALYLFIKPERRTTIRTDERSTVIRAESPGLHKIIEQVAHSDAYLVLDRGLKIVSASDAYLDLTYKTRDELIGSTVAEAFPENPDYGNGGSAISGSFRRVLREKVPDHMRAFRYDIRRPDGAYEECWWRPVNSPIIGHDGEVAYIVNAVVRVTPPR